MVMDLHKELTDRAETSRTQSIERVDQEDTWTQPHNPASYEAGYYLGRAHGLEEARDLALVYGDR